jgi:hypothetical protein
MRLRLKIEKFFVEQLWQLLIVVAFVVFCACIFDKPIEAFLFCVSHTVIRQAFGKQYHCGTTAVCLCVTFSIAFFGIMTILPFAVSLLSTVPICFVISFAGYIAQDRVDLIVANHKLREQIAGNGEFSLEDCTEDALLARCKELGLSEENTWLAVEFFIKKTKHSKIAEKFCIEEHSVTARKLRLKNKLKK